MNFYLLPSLECGPSAVRHMLRGIPVAKWDASHDPERFSLREVVAHLADWEPIMRSRIQAAVEHPGATIEAFDEGQMAIDHGYAESDPIEEADKFVRERRLTAEYIRSLTPEQMSHAAVHQERGPQTAEDLANLLLGHDLYHIEQLAGYLDLP